MMVAEQLAIIVSNALQGELAGAIGEAMLELECEIGDAGPRLRRLFAPRDEDHRDLRLPRGSGLQRPLSAFQSQREMAF